MFASCLVLRAAAGYDDHVAGLDEARARSVLADMQDRLARDPSAALGLAASASTDDIRTAFLELTKQFHPVRFGRMAADVQKMANEVFLALRAAHDQLAKSARRQSGPISRPPQAVPSPMAAAGTGRTVQPIPPRPPTAARPPTAPAARPSASPAPIGRTALRPAAPGAAPARPAPPPAPLLTEAAIVELLQKQQWNEARTALLQLQARDPASKKIRALMSYARGREAQLDRRLDDARVELHDALDLDPDLQLAKTALTELFTRRK